MNPKDGILMILPLLRQKMRKKQERFVQPECTSGTMVGIMDILKIGRIAVVAIGQMT